MEQRHRLTPEERENRLSAGLLRDFRYVTPDAVTASILEGKPYRIRGAFVQASNPLSSWNNVKRTCEAFSRLEFLAVSDFFMTPTAALADIVFPSSTFLESDAVRVGPGGSAAILQRKVAQVGNCRPDHEIINGLAREVGIGADFWKTSEDLWDYMLQPAGLTYREFCAKGIIREARPRRYRKYLQDGFLTPSGKVELFSRQLREMGFDPVPVYHPSFSTGDCRVITEEFDLICTCRKVTPYQHSSGRQIDKFREMHPFPLIMIHPDAARERNISDGDWVYVESKNGIIKMKASLTRDVHARVVVSEHAWWFPERGPADLYGFADSNYNTLTCSGISNAEVGSFVARGIACKVSRAS
jgi:anaerobic selenocysteine-containing dehydrogenase